jgi:hypothetical protein
MSRGTDMCRSIMSGTSSQNGKGKMEGVCAHSSAFSTLFSMASAGFPNTALQTCVCMAIRAGKNQISPVSATRAAGTCTVLADNAHLFKGPPQWLAEGIRRDTRREPPWVVHRHFGGEKVLYGDESL